MMKFPARGGRRKKSIPTHTLQADGKIIGSLLCHSVKLNNYLLPPSQFSGLSAYQELVDRYLVKTEKHPEERGDEIWWGSTVALEGRQ